MSKRIALIVLSSMLIILSIPFQNIGPKIGYAVNLENMNPVQIVRLYYRYCNKGDADKAMEIFSYSNRPDEAIRMIRNSSFYMINEISLVNEGYNSATVYVNITCCSRHQSPEGWKGKIDLTKSGNIWKILNMDDLSIYN